jgi:uncharacterized membrane protein YgcG
VRHAFLAAAAAAGILAAATSARANGRFPASNQILFSPTQPSWIVVRNTYGITISKDNGGSWYWLCEDTLGLGPQSNEDPFLGLTNNNSIVAGLSLGLQVSSDLGCNWTVEGGPLKGQLVKDLVVHQENPSIIDTITNTFSPTVDMGDAGYSHGFFESIDNGMTWTQFGTDPDDSADVTTIEVAPSDPSRIYVSGFHGSGMTRTTSLYVSKDKGMTWTEHQTPFNPSTETAVYIAAVDPNDEDLVYLRTEGASRLIVSMDGGQTFMSSKQLMGQMVGFALSPDGSKIYLGGVGDGLWVGDKATLTFVQTNSLVHIQCLATQGTDLWACADEPSCFVAGVSHDDGKTFTAKMHLLSIQAPLQCPADSGAAFCSGPPFVSLCSNVGACYDVDAAPVLPLTSTCSCSGACASNYDAGANCPIVGNDASLYCPLTDSGGPSTGSSSSGGGGGSGSGGGGGGSSGAGSGGGGGSGGSSKSCGCDVVGGGGTLGFFAAGALGALGAARLRRRRKGGRA